MKARTAGKGAVSAATASRGSAIPAISIAPFFCFRQAFGIGSGKIDHKSNHGDRLVSETQYPGAVHLEEAGQRGGGTHQQPPADRLEVDAIVGDEPRKE